MIEIVKQIIHTCARIREETVDCYPSGSHAHVLTYGSPHSFSFDADLLRDTCTHIHTHNTHTLNNIPQQSRISTNNKWSNRTAAPFRSANAYVYRFALVSRQRHHTWSGFKSNVIISGCVCVRFRVCVCVLALSWRFMAPRMCASMTVTGYIWHSINKRFKVLSLTN